MGALCAHVRSSVFNVGETVGNCVASCHLPTHQTMTGHLLQKDGHCDPLKRRYALKKNNIFIGSTLYCWLGKYVNVHVH